MSKVNLDELIERAASKKDSVERGRIAAKARKLVKPKPSKRIGAPTKYTEAKATTIIKAISNGQTLTSVARELGLSNDCVYGWLRDYPAFAESYQFAKESMARSLLDEMLDDAKGSEPDKALLLKVKSSIFQWAISRLNPGEFSDSRKIKLEAEVTHTLAHELPIEQRKRIAESWLASQSDNADIGRVIEHEPEPDTGVSVVTEPEREVPKRKKPAALPAKKKLLDDDDASWRGGG